MNIVKLGNHQNKKGEFHFVCKKCGCEWYADRGDKGLGISPPCCEFYAYMKCPTCKVEVIDEANKKADEVEYLNSMVKSMKSIS